jgi:hypothetical protein
LNVTVVVDDGLLLAGLPFDDCGVCSGRVDLGGSGSIVAAASDGADREGNSGASRTCDASDCGASRTIPSHTETLRHGGTVTARAGTNG